MIASIRPPVFTVRHRRFTSPVCRTSCVTVCAYPLDRNHKRTFEALEARDYIEHVTWGRWQITPLGEIVAKQLAKKGNR